ncbi:MAG: hypothetical protein JST54_08175 [Deltaproteobacteria bacterium]|nr:hypothetical protein [Deltaproteobacteria bacterium]
MAELPELLAPIPRPTAPHLRLRRHRRLGVLARRLAPYAAVWLASVGILYAAWLPGASKVVLGFLLQPGTLVAVFALIFALFYLRVVALRRLVQRNVEGILYISSGRAAQAAALYDDLALRGRGRMPYHALFVGNRGVVATLQGQLEQGRILLGEALRSGWFTGETSTAAGGYFAAFLARNFALEGDMRSAAAWREVATVLIPSTRKGTLLLADAVILLRSGHPRRAAEAIAAQWMGAEGELGAHERRALRTLQAFALSQVAGRDDEVEEALAGLWPPVEGQLDYLGVRWPELRTFVASRVG